MASYEEYVGLNIYPFPRKNDNDLSQPLTIDSNDDQTNLPDVVITTSDDHLGFIDITEHCSRKGDNPVVFKTPEGMSKKRDAEKYSEHPLVLRRRFETDSKPPVWRSTTLEVNDAILREALSHALRYHPFIDLSGPSIEISRPYSELFWFRNELTQYAEDPARTEIQRSKLRLLFDFIEDKLRDTIDLWQRHVPHHRIPHLILWTLYRPNTIIVSNVDDMQRCYLVKRCWFVKEMSSTVISCYYWSYENGTFGKVSVELSIPSFEGVKAITDLDYVPWDSIPSAEQLEIKDRLVSRGHKWKKLLTYSHVEYKGIVTTFQPKPKEQEPSRISRRSVQTYETNKLFVDGRIITDQNTFSRYNPNVVPELDNNAITNASYKAKQDSSRISLDVFCKVPDAPNLQLSDEQALLCPPTVEGYGLAAKIWGRFLVDCIEEIAFDTNCFDRLQMDKTTKDFIQSLITVHEVARTKTRDIVARKGVGRVFLFHGPPGSGKTLTAETVSEYTKKPLYCATSGELGTDVKRVETELKKVFDLSQTWGAILLIDEADVFLAKRTTEDINRNAYVSIFLRYLEYYQGVMILTTNRRDDFDQAFESRVHLTLQYVRPNEVQRSAMWKNLFERHYPNTPMDEDLFRQLGKSYDLNGREIKNLFATAYAHSIYKGETVKFEILDSLYKLR